MDTLGFENGESIAQKEAALNELLSTVTEMIDSLSKHDEPLEISDNERGT